MKIQFATVGREDGVRITGMHQWMSHPAFAWAGLRPIQAQHTEAEHRALERYGRGRRSVVELGVAEGASAVALREVMHEEGILYLVDPYHLSRLPTLNFLRRAAHRAVEAKRGPKVVWLEKFSYEAVKDWTTAIDFLFIDGDHDEKAVEQDWRQWSPFVGAGGIAAFHDACVFPGGWTWADYGPVKFVEREFRRNRESAWEIVEQVDSLVVVRAHKR